MRNQSVVSSLSPMRWMLLVVLCMTLFALGCERKPEDLEQWRNAEGGMDKMQEWVVSKEESVPVRVRAAQILIEQDQANALPPLLDKIKDESVRDQVVKGAIVTVEELWKAQDFPEMTEEQKKKGGNLTVPDSKELRGVEAAYYLQPYAKGEDQKKLEAMLADWMSRDQDFRDRASSRVTLAQALPRAGEKGFDSMMVWFGETKKPGQIAQAIRQYGDDATKAKFDEAIKARVEKDHPNLSPELRTIMLTSDSDVMLPYLERAIKDPNSPGELADDAMDAYVRIQGPKATTLLNELVATRKDLMRSVAITRLIELRGEAGVTQAMTALPLESEAYATSGDNTLQKDAPYICNIIDTELEKSHKVEDEKPVVKKMLEMPRWPAQVIAMQCAKMKKWSDWKPAIEAMQNDQQVVPGWGEGPTSVGDIAKDVAASL